MVAKDAVCYCKLVPPPDQSILPGPAQSSPVQSDLSQSGQVQPSLFQSSPRVKARAVSRRWLPLTSRAVTVTGAARVDSRGSVSPLPPLSVAKAAAEEGRPRLRHCIVTRQERCLDFAIASERWSERGPFAPLCRAVGRPAVLPAPLSGRLCYRPVSRERRVTHSNSPVSSAFYDDRASNGGVCLCLSGQTSTSGDTSFHGAMPF